MEGTGSGSDVRKTEAGGGDDNRINEFMKELSVLDDEQATMMTEECIMVDSLDRPIRSTSKVRIEQTSSMHTALPCIQRP